MDCCNALQLCPSAPIHENTLTTSHADNFLTTILNAYRQFVF